MRRIVLVIAVVVALALPATAAAAINITFIRYNPPGPDTGSNTSLDNE
jgi:P pilus assembly chaperone PapD